MPPPAPDALRVRGRYLAATTCSICHGPALSGEEHPEGLAPDLRIVGAYSREDFARLMRTGIGLGGRKLGVMTGWARENLSAMNDEEVASLFSYLDSLPAH